MKIQMRVIDVNMLDDYIDRQVVPFSVCVSEGAKVSKKQQIFLEKYYDKISDKRGWNSYYCNVINAWKCKGMGYTSIEFPDGIEKQIKAYNLEKSTVMGGKYVVVPYFSLNDKIDAEMLVEKVRLDVEKIKSRVNAVSGR